MCEKQSNAPLEAAQTNRPVLTLPNPEEKEKLKQSYLTLSRRLHLNISADCPETTRLWMLHRKIKQFVKTLTVLDRPWQNGMPELQKSFLNSMISSNLPRPDRQKLQDEWIKFSEFLLAASFYRGYISQMLQYFYRQLNDIENILGYTPDDSEEAPRR